MRGRKASITPIAIFVMMTISVCIGSLLIFYFAESEIKTNLMSPLPVINLYSERDILKVYMYEDLRQSVIESYNELAKQQSQVSDTPICEEFGGKKVFCSVDVGLRANFETETKRRFLENLKLTDVQDKLKENGIDLSLDVNSIDLKLDSNFSLNIKNVAFTFTQEGTGIEIIAKYSFNISQNLSLSDVGLVSFEDIHKKIQTCKIADFNTCFKFNEFSSTISDARFGDRDFYEVKMVSNREFFVDGELKPIEVEFLIVK